MKSCILIWITILILCIDIHSGNHETNPKNIGGKYITSTGELKVLVVFAKFKDDTSSHQFWPADSYPEEMNTFIDPDTQKGSTHFLNLTNYYNQMSLGKFKVTGRVIGAETPYPKSNYLLLNKSCLNRSKANTDILKLIDDHIDYNEFDNWTYLGQYKHSNQPDGIVDMIIVIWRGLVFSDQWSGESSLGYGAEFLVENNSKKIRMNYYYSTDSEIFGSGFTVQYWGERSRERNFKNCIHELGHWLIQEDHPYNKHLHSFWGMLTLGCEGICANSIERERLGWITPVEIENPLTIDLDDYLTSGSSCKYHITDNDTDEYYYFENHQKLSIYDDATVNTEDKGIFILQLSNPFYKGDCVRIISSDGFWDWEITGQSNCWGNTLSIFRKVLPNRNGYSHRDKLIIENVDCGFLYCYQDENDFIECSDFPHGYSFKSSFDTTYKDIFSKWSNPQAKTSSNEAIDFTMEIVSQENSKLKVQFGDLTITESEKDVQKNQINFILYQNYPNPFNSGTKIRFTIPTLPSSSPLSKGRNESLSRTSFGMGFVSLKVYDILGNEVLTLVDEYKQAGVYEFEFNASTLPSGIYFYRLQSGDFSETKKMTLLK
jgi:M6 family metalloprotease-like protein